MVKHASVRNWFFYASHLIISMLHTSSMMMRQCMLRSPCCLWPKPKADFYAWLEHSSMRCLEPWSWRCRRDEERAFSWAVEAAALPCSSMSSRWCCGY
jgi:hypothetical protein